MDELRHWFNDIPEDADTFAGTLLIGGIGAYFYIMNWLIFINNMIPGRKWSSMVPPLGGLIIAVLILILGGGWWALIGLTDPAIYVLIYSISKGAFGRAQENRTNEEEKDDKNDNGD